MIRELIKLASFQNFINSKFNTCGIISRYTQNININLENASIKKFLSVTFMFSGPKYIRKSY